MDFCSNIGKEHIKGVAVFSSPGFEDYMRDVSVREGEKNVPLSETEDAEIAKRHPHDVITRNRKSIDLCVSSRINYVANDDEECSRPVELVQAQNRLFV